MEKRELDAVNIGEKIQAYRQQKGLNIKELSRLVGISPSMLSQMERNLANPSINTLKALSAALETPLYYFFMGESHKEEVVVRPQDRKTVVTPQITEGSYRLLTPDASGELSFYEMYLSPFHGATDRSMVSESEKVCLVQAGEVTLFMDDQEYHLLPGDSARIPPRSRHGWLNRGKEEARVVIATAAPLL